MKEESTQRLYAATESHSVMANKKVRIIPLGGLGEVGKNMTVFEIGNDAIIVDTGIMFPANDMFGVDYIIPDFQYLTDRKKDLNIHGILYTHGHEDHIGAVRHVVEAFPGLKLYGTKLTIGLIEVKLTEANLLDKASLHTIEAGDIVELGPFKAESFHVCHSIPGCVGYGINTPHGIVVHTGDYKFDNTPVGGLKPDYARLAGFSQRGVKLLMGDSTNAMSSGWTPSESVIDPAFDKVFRQAKGRIIVATFASLISRVQQVVWAAERYGRKIAFAGYSMRRNVDMAIDLGILDVPEGMIIDLNRINTLAPSKVTVMATGSQGEPSAVLSRMSMGRHKIEVMSDDTIILSSHPIPGNEEMVARIINDLLRRGANVIFDPLEDVHVSGHGNREELRLMLNLTRPENVLPIHGELRMLKAHADLAVESGVPRDHVFVAENGTVVEIDEKGVRIGERVPGGYVFVDGSGVGDVGRAVLRDREILSQDGFIIVVADVDRNNHRLLSEPEIISRGFVYLRQADELMDKINNAVASTVQSANGTSRVKLQERIEGSLAQMLYHETKRRPMVFSVINEV
jgi:ribonuclease J